jgi:hypothetical protein
MCAVVFSTSILWQLFYVFFTLAQDGDTSSGSNSPYELEEENIIRKKATGKEATISRTFKHPTARPPKNKD